MRIKERNELKYQNKNVKTYFKVPDFLERICFHAISSALFIDSCYCHKSIIICSLINVYIHIQLLSRSTNYIFDALFSSLTKYKSFMTYGNLKKKEYTNKTIELLQIKEPVKHICFYFLLFLGRQF